MRAIKIIFLLLPFFLFSNCTKEERSPQELRKAESEVKFKIPASPENWYRDGAMYNDSYLVWAQDTSNNRMLVCYDLVNKVKSWETSFDGVATWGRTMVIYGDVLVVDRDDMGITIFDLNEKEIIVNYRYDSSPNFTSNTTSTFFEGKIYKAVLAPYDGLAKIISFDVENGAMKTEYEWDSSSNSKESLTSPLVYYNEITEKVNLTMILQLSNFNSEPIEYGATYLINVSEDNTVNWIDTIKPNRSAIFDLPIIVGDDIILKYSDLLISYNKNTGKRNWTETAEIAGIEKLINRDGEIYLNSRDFSRLSRTDGHIIWNQKIGAHPSTIGDFEVVNNDIIYVPSGFGNLTVLDNQTGEFIQITDENLERIANPKFYKEQNVFITHTKNEVIGFIIK